MGRWADQRLEAAAFQRAACTESAINGPASAEPIGLPSELSDIDTANARPNQAGAARPWRNVKTPMSNGPAARPTRVTPTATPARLFTDSRIPIATTPTLIANTHLTR